MRPHALVSVLVPGARSRPRRGRGRRARRGGARAGARRPRAEAPHAPARARSAARGRANTAVRYSPPSNPLNQDISRGAGQPQLGQLHREHRAQRATCTPTSGPNPGYGIPYTVVGPRSAEGADHVHRIGEESNPGPYPIPPTRPWRAPAKKATGTCSCSRKARCKLYELYDARAHGRGLGGGLGAVFNLRSNALRPEGWTSADAAGLPIFPLLVRYPEVRAGRIDHALRVTVPRTQRGYIPPATHYASSSSDPDLPPMGLRLRLKASYSLAGFHGESLIVLRALKRYGLIVADNGSPGTSPARPTRAGTTKTSNRSSGSRVGLRSRRRAGPIHHRELSDAGAPAPGPAAAPGRLACGSLGRAGRAAPAATGRRGGRLRGDRAGAGAAQRAGGDGLGGRAWATACGGCCAARSSASAGLDSPLIESLNSRMPEPSERPISGSRLAPNTSSRITTRKAM